MSEKKRRSSQPSEEELAILEELNLPVLSSTASGALSEVQRQLRTSKANSTTKAVWFCDRDHPGRPGELNGHPEIKDVKLDCSKATLNSIVATLRGDGHTCIAYAKGVLIPVRLDDDD